MFEAIRLGRSIIEGRKKIALNKKRQKEISAQLERIRNEVSGSIVVGVGVELEVDIARLTVREPHIQYGIWVQTAGGEGSIVFLVDG